jgi:DNA-binding CsgD family transcriptional regulator
MHDSFTTSSAMAMQSALDLLDYGIVLCDAHASLHHANRAAERELRQSRYVTASAGVVRATDLAQDRELRHAICKAAGGQRAMVRLSSAAGPFSVAAVPLASSTDGQGSNTVMLLFGRARACESLTIDLFARETGITAAEAAVLHALIDGQSTQQICDTCAVAMCTVRSHISSLRQKTGARSISELVRLTTVLPPVVPVLY